MRTSTLSKCFTSLVYLYEYCSVHKHPCLQSAPPPPPPPPTRTQPAKQQPTHPTHLRAPHPFRRRPRRRRRRRRQLLAGPSRANTHGFECPLPPSLRQLALGGARLLPQPSDFGTCEGVVLRRCFQQAFRQKAHLQVSFRFVSFSDIGRVHSVETGLVLGKGFNDNPTPPPASQPASVRARIRNNNRALRLLGVRNHPFLTGAKRRRESAG